MTDYPELLKLVLFLASRHQWQLLSNSRSNINISNSTKIYIGYLPVSMNDVALREIFQRHCPVSQVIIKKGNAQGHFDKFCYGFVTMNLPEKEALEIINKISNEYPNWRLKVKQDGPDNQPKQQKYPRQQNYSQQQQYQQQPTMYQYRPPQMQPPIMQPQSSIPHHQPIQNRPHQQHSTVGMPPMHQQSHSQYPQQPMNPMPNYNFSQQPQNDKGEIYGQKKNRIMVRQLWLGGIPEMIDHNYMTEVMSQFGLVQATQIFPKFAFVKFKRAADAAIAYQRASRIYEIFGQNPGFRISFSDPSRRKEIVGNHFQFEKSAILLPILFLGFPPITSANVDIGHMMNICDKFGTITNYYLKKSTNAQMRSYILFTYDNLKSALRAKQELCRRKDLLGQKRVQITLLLDEQSVLKGRDFTYTQRNFVGEPMNDKVKKPTMKPGFNPNMPSAYGTGYTNMPLIPGNYQMPIMPQSAQGYGYGGYGANIPQYGGYYPPQPYETTQKPAQTQSNQVLDILHSVYDDQAQEKKKGPQKKPTDKQQNPNDIIKNMLGKGFSEKNKNEEDQGEIHENEHGHEKQPNWSGFITWKGGRRTGVDGFAINQSDFSDFSINISSLIANEDILLKQKANMMILEPTNSISEPVFNDYVKVLKKRGGISMTKNWLIYIIGKNELSQSIVPIKDNQLLVIMEKPTIVAQIKDKTIAITDGYFE